MFRNPKKRMSKKSGEQVAHEQTPEDRIRKITEDEKFEESLWDELVQQEEADYLKPFKTARSILRQSLMINVGSKSLILGFATYSWEALLNGNQFKASALSAGALAVGSAIERVHTRKETETLIKKPVDIGTSKSSLLGQELLLNTGGVAFLGGMGLSGLLDPTLDGRNRTVGACLTALGVLTGFASTSSYVDEFREVKDAEDIQITEPRDFDLY